MIRHRKLALKIVFQYKTQDEAQGEMIEGHLRR